MRIMWVTPLKCQYFSNLIIILSIYRLTGGVRRVSEVSGYSIYLNDNNKIHEKTDRSDTRLTGVSGFYHTEMTKQYGKS
jgi:hypothetical protein